MPTREEIAAKAAQRREWPAEPQEVTPQRLLTALLRVRECVREVARLREEGMLARIVPAQNRLRNKARILWRDYCWWKGIDPEPPASEDADEIEVAETIEV